MNNDSVLQRQLSLVELLDLASFTEVCKSFVDLYRVGVKVFAADGTRLVDVKTGSGDFCAYMFTRTPGKQLCTETVTYLRTHPMEPDAHASQSRDCFSGCRYVMTPIVHEGDVVGRIVFGPFVPDDVGGPAPRLVALGKEGVFDLQRAADLMGRIRQAPESTIRKVIDHFARIVEVIVYTSYRGTLTSQLHIESITDSYRELQEKSKSLRESYERLKELDRLKSNFLATVSHELRTPLTSVIGYSEMLLAGLAGEVNDEQREYLGTILEKGESLLNLITSILDLSKIEARGVSLNVRSSDLSALVASAVSTVLPQAMRKELEIVTEVQPSLPAVLVDPDKLRQCLVNLLSNAVKFSPERRKVTVRARLATQAPDDSGPFGRNGHFELSVQDQGVGIAASQLDRVFESFYQEDSSSTREYGGAGLGLSIVKSYTEAHGGAVRATSEHGVGSTFTLVIPLRTGAPSATPGEAS